MGEAVKAIDHSFLVREFESRPSLMDPSSVMSPDYLRRSLGPFSLEMYTTVAVQDKLFYCLFTIVGDTNL